MYVTYVDESGNGSEAFVVGALTARSEPSWAQLSIEWKAVLDAEPAIPFFKFNNPHRLSAEDHEAKLVTLIEIMNRHIDRADVVLIDVPEYESYFKGLMGISYDNPFHFGYMHIVQQCALHLPEPNATLTYIFDQLDDLQFAELVAGFGNFKLNCPDEKVRARLDRPPERRNDRDVLPLQAADLWAGLNRATYRGDSSAVPFLKRVTIRNRAWEWDMSALATLLGKSVERFPGLTSGEYYETRSSRKKRLAKDRKPD